MTRTPITRGKEITIRNAHRRTLFAILKTHTWFGHYQANTNCKYIYTYRSTQHITVEDRLVCGYGGQQRQRAIPRGWATKHTTLMVELALPPLCTIIAKKKTKQKYGGRYRWFWLACLLAYIYIRNADWSKELWPKRATPQLRTLILCKV